MAQLVWAAEAERWLKDIYGYIAKEDPSAALGVVEGIYSKAQLLLDFPEAGYKYTEVDANVRILLYGHYRITYVIEGDQITVLGVFHGALEIENYLL